MNERDPIGLIVASETKFNSQLSYPEPVLAGLSISEWSNRKIVWKVGLFKAEYVDNDSEFVGAGDDRDRFDDQGGETGTERSFGRKVRIARDAKTGRPVGAAAWGTMTHVFVERGGERNKVVESLPARWKPKLEAIYVEEEEET